MEPTNTKSRTPSRCREWERQRRIKFNEAIFKLGELVKEINRPTNVTSKDTDNVQYPKVEIIQKAIICLTTFVQEKTQLKAEILALQVELDVFNNKKNGMKDATTQVFLSLGKKIQNDNNKQMKLLMLQKSKRNALKEKPILMASEVVGNNSKHLPVQKLPMLLPRSNINNNKKRPENTIVVLPATPYIFPQRPLLFPTVPPAIVLLDPNLQTLNKATGSVVNRNNGEVTKTTMVNILPISAYSRPLSATKVKKVVKAKKENSKKTHKIEKKDLANSLESTENNDINKNKIQESSEPTQTAKINTINTHNSNVELKENNTNECIDSENRDINKKTVPSIDEVFKSNSNNVSLPNDNKETISKINENQQNKQTDVNEVPKNSSNDVTLNEKNSLTSPSEVEKSSNRVIIDQNSVLNKFSKTPSEKVSIPIDKEKENKIPNILETTLCDTAVDGGNARLELAEEFLAASPTAAFLMSFPLVSGNRADSPAEEAQNVIQNMNTKDSRRSEGTAHTSNPFFEKPSINDTKLKTPHKHDNQAEVLPKHNEPIKYTENLLFRKQPGNKTTTATTNSNISNENPFLNLSMPSIISTNGTASDSTFGLDFECNLNKSIQNQSTGYASNSNFFYKSDPFNTVKNSIYSTSSISSSHDFNNIGLYPCAMEKYSSKSKCDYSNVEDNLMKIGSSRLTYDIDLGWSHKSFDFVNCTTTSNTFNKDNILTNVSAPYSTTYNPFNPEFHVPLVSNSSKKDNMNNKTNTSIADTITSFYSQPTNFWSEDVPFYTNNSIAKTTIAKHQNYLNIEALPTNANTKQNEKDYNATAKQPSDLIAPNVMKPTNVPVEPQTPEKYTKKSPSKMHINWMTSEIRHMESNCNSVPIEVKEGSKTLYPQTNHSTKKQDQNESYFPISMHNFASQPTQEEFQMWPPTRAIGPTEVTIEPPPINLPTLVGDLALGPHERKKNSESSRPLIQTQDLQNCTNFLSVTQLMNRSSDNMSSRYQVPNIETTKTGITKQASNYFPNDVNRKTGSSRVESQLSQPCYGFNETKALTAYESVNQFTHSKTKLNKSDKSSKSQKNSYSAEALIRGGNCTQKIQENSSAKFTASSQKYNEFNATQDSAIAQVSHFPPIIDYSDNSYTSQQFSGTTLYNTTTNTISNTFYSNFMPGSSNLMSSNYTSAPFTGEFIDYSQSECNFANHKYEELKMRNTPNAFPQDKVPSNYKSSRRETTTKHKLECSKKEVNKKYQSKRIKLNNDVEDWSDPSHHLLWQNKASSKRHSNLGSEELTYPNYGGNQMPTQYQPEYFNSHLMPSNVQTVGHNVDRSLSFPVTSRANFNLSTIFPEITMKVQ